MKPQTIYLVKDRKDSEKFKWRVMNRMEFLIFLASPESKGRLYARLDKDPECPNIVYEASKSQYKKWRKAKRHKQYLSDCEEELGITVVSLNALLFDTSINGESMLASNEDVFETVWDTLEIQRIRELWPTLSKREQWVLTELVIKQKTEKQLSQESGVPKSTLNGWKAQTLAKLRINF